MRKWQIVFPTLMLVLLLWGSASLGRGAPKTLEDHRMPTDLPEAFTLTESARAEIASRTPPVDCPVTTAEVSSFEAAPPYSANAPWTGFFWFGHDELWTALPTDGVWADLPHNTDGYTQKIPWWGSLVSLNNDPEPALVVTGRRLDAEAPPLKFYGASNAFADDLGQAMMTGVDFPTTGCWKITGNYQEAELSFVVWVAP